MNIFIVGASARAAAQSALRSGLHPECADLFADEDLRRICPAQAVPLDQYPQAFWTALQQGPDCPWLYVGGLENHPRLIDALARERPLLGNNGSVLRKVRSPRWLSDTARREGLLYPDCTSAAPGTAWIIKPIRGCGGKSIRRTQPGTHYDRRRYHAQAFIDGMPHAALFRADGRNVIFAGAVRQLIGRAEFHASGFCYCGGIGPVPLPKDAERDLRRWAEVLVRDAGLTGLFGIDLVLANRRAWLVEVNPRYTASVEVLEHACAWNSLNANSRPGEARGLVGKAIVFAPLGGVVAQGPWHAETDWRYLPDHADVPAAGTRVERGRPIMTVFARGASQAEVLRSLVGAANRVAGDALIAI